MSKMRAWRRQYELDPYEKTLSQTEMHSNAPKLMSIYIIFSIKYQYQNAPECTKMNIDFQKFSGGDAPGPPLTAAGIHPLSLIQILAALIT